jgi:calmodulin
MFKQLNLNNKSNEELIQSRKTTQLHNTKDTGNNGLFGAQKRKIGFPYPKFSKPEYQQQFLNDIIEREEGIGKNSGEQTNNFVNIDKKDIEQAFKFFDINKKNRITPNDLKRRLKIFYPNMLNSEYKFLVSDNNFTIEKLEKILNCNVKTNFDPYKEAFKIFDPNETGYIDMEVLRNMMTQLGYGQITEKDLKVLIESADADKDGKVSLEDFKNMLHMKAEKRLEDNSL